MKIPKRTIGVTACLWALLGMSYTPAWAWQDPILAEADGEVLTRGPVHEAFAEVVAFQPEAGLIITAEPPPAVEEVPPDQRPEGATWIPGYWFWDDDQDRFVWLTGIWRVLPPGTQWNSGYWAKVPEGFQWVSGYWAKSGADVVDYYPPPPESLETGPSTPAPSAEHLWIPGNWLWRDHYVWQAGYWTAAQQNWMWVPAHYVWTPNGYIYVSGYWDYPVDRRGVMFAPVYFSPTVYGRPGFNYAPSVVINSTQLVANLFLRPRYCHYYFGDYYGGNYQTAGYYPWFSVYSRGRGYDPIYAHQHWYHGRHDSDWHHRIERDYDHRHAHPDARPPHTYRDLHKSIANVDPNRVRDAAIAMPLKQMAQTKGGSLRFQAVAQTERDHMARRGHEVSRYQQERHKLEAQAGPGDGHKKRSEPARITMPKAPVVSAPLASSPAGGSKRDGRPERRDVLKPKVGDVGDPISGQTPRGRGISPNDPRIDPSGAAGGASGQRGRPRDGSRPSGQPQETPRIDPTPGGKVETKGPPRTDPDRPRGNANERPRIDVPPKTVPRVDPGQRPNVDPRSAPRVDPGQRPNVDPRSTPRVDPGQRPNVDPRSTPRVDPGQRPNVDPRSTPRVDPSQRPNVDPNPKRSPPRVDPGQRPNVDPRSAPRADVKPRLDPPRARSEPSSPRVETFRPRTEPTQPAAPARPRMDSPPRSQPAQPRVEPRSQPAQPRVDPPRSQPAQPRVERPRPQPAQPRVDSPRPQPSQPRVEPQRSAPRASPPPRADKPAAAGHSPKPDKPNKGNKPDK